MTSSPSATGPVSSGYATHGTPSTSQRTRSSCRSAIPVTVPRRRLTGIASGLHERERDIDHPLEVGDRDPLVRRMDVRHSVGEIDALQPALVEDVGVGAAAAQAVARLETALLERSRGEPHRLVVALEPVAARARIDLGLDVAITELRCEGDRLEHLLDELAELALVMAARLGRERAVLRHDVAGRAAADLADIRGRLLVQTAEPKIGDRPRCRSDRRAPFLRKHSGMGGAAVERRVQLALVGRTENHLADRAGMVVHVAELGAQPLVVEGGGAT